MARNPTRCRQPLPHVTCAPAPPKSEQGAGAALKRDRTTLAPASVVRVSQETDWDRIVLLLRRLAANPIHLQSWHSIAQSPSAWRKAQPRDSNALEAAASLAGDGALAGYHLFPSVRGDLAVEDGQAL